jgi:hypothetical protein
MAPCIYKDCITSSRRPRTKHNKSLHYQCRKCTAVAPAKLQSAHNHEFASSPLPHPKQPPKNSKNPRSCWCERCTDHAGTNIARHGKKPHYICETCDDMQETLEVFVGARASRLHKKSHPEHTILEITKADSTKRSTSNLVDPALDYSAYSSDTYRQPSLDDTTMAAILPSIELSRTKGPGQPSLEELHTALRESQRIVCFVGAGISTSGGSMQTTVSTTIRALISHQFPISALLRDSSQNLR